MAAINKLSARQVEAIRKNKTVGKHFDGGGLYLQVTDAGGMYWRYKYRLGGKEKLYAIGTLDDFGLAEARIEHANARKIVMHGDDPVQVRTEKKAEKEAVRAAARPFREVAQEWFDTMVPASASDSTKDRHTRSIEAMNVAFGNKAITELEASDLAGVLAKYEAEEKFATRERVQGTGVSIGGYCVGRGYLKVNPFREVSYAQAFTSAGSVGESRPALVDVKPFGDLVRNIDCSSERQLNKYALRLLALLAVRPGELVKAEWSHFLFDEAKMIVPAQVLKQRTQRKKSKDPRAGKAFEVPLSRQAIAELRGLHRLTGHSQYLFPIVRTGLQTKLPYMQRSTINDALHRMGYMGLHCSHGFRSAFSTIMNASRVEVNNRKELIWPEQSALIEVQLDHNDASTKAIYDRGGRWEERAELMQLWADRIDQMRNNDAPKPHDKPRLQLVA